MLLLLLLLAQYLWPTDVSKGVGERVAPSFSTQPNKKRPNAVGGDEEVEEE